MEMAGAEIGKCLLTSEMVGDAYDANGADPCLLN
jgi:hypothetical protein